MVVDDTFFKKDLDYVVVKKKLMKRVCDVKVILGLRVLFTAQVSRIRFGAEK